MTNKIEKRSLKNEIHPRDVFYYDFDAKELKVPKPWKQGEGDFLYPQIQNWAAETAKGEGHIDTEPTIEQQRLFDDARLFVEELSGYDLSDVTLKMAVGGARGSQTAKYSPLDNAVYFYGDFSTGESNPETDYNEYIVQGLFVHELMHATNRNNYKIVGIRSSSNAMQLQPVSGLSRVDMRGPILEVFGTSDGEDIRTGKFFEEAFAEEAAARWREENGEYAGEDIYHFSSPLTPDMPRRYVCDRSRFVKEGTGAGISWSAYCTEALRQISIYTDVDLFELMLAARDPSKEASAQRKIAQAVESVQKGLYVTLRETNYTSVAFINTYEKVLEAIEHNKNVKSAIGRYAAA